MAELKTVISVTSNGVGMGHICRQLAVLLSGEKQFNSVILSLSGALPRIAQTSLTGEFPEAAAREVGFEYSPSRKTGWHQRDGWRGAIWRKYPGYRWEHYLADRIVALVEETGASELIFDGVAAYDGVIEATKRLQGVRTNWFRPCLWQSGVPASRLEREHAFDRVIEPGDYAAEFDQGPTVGRADVTKVAPVSLTEVLKLNDRPTARAALGLPAEGPVLLLAPGAGAVGSVDDIGRDVIDQLRTLGPEWTVAVTQQAIAQHSLAKAHGRIKVLDDVFPLARHLAAFDAAVSASGYNAANELMCERVPTLFIPSLNHETDDQPMRAYGLAKKGAALDVTDLGLEKSVALLMDSDVRAELVEGCKSLPKATGGAETAALLAEDSPIPANPSLSGKFSEPGRPLLDLRPVAAKGKPSFEIRESVKVDDLRGETPIEHVLPGSSSGYRERRQQIANWLYR